jgi:hypothetical protein
LVPHSRSSCPRAGFPLAAGETFRESLGNQ